MKPCNHTWGGSRADGTPTCIKCGEVRTDRIPVGQALDVVIDILDVAADMALTPGQYDEIAAEVVRLKQITVRANLVLRLIAAPQRSRLQTVQ